MYFLMFLAMGCVKDEVLLELSDAQNYSLQSTLTADSQVVASGEDTEVIWTNLTSDLQGEEMDPTSDIDEVRVIRFGSMTQEEILDGINTDTLKQSDITGFAAYHPESGETTAMLTEFAFFNVYVDPAEEIVEGMGTFLLSALTGEYDYRMFSFFEPTEGEDVVPIELHSDSAQLDFDVDLQSAELVTSKRAHHYIIDWTGLTEDAYDNDLEVSNIDSLLLARYTLDLTEIEDQFVELEYIYDEAYEAEIGGSGEYDLMEATDADGNAFAGFEGEGTWLLALRCSTCINPAPLFIGIFEG